jgi:hypothetical protein
MRQADRTLGLSEGGAALDLYEDVDTSGIPIVPELEDEDTLTMDICRDFPYDYTLLLENLLDVGCGL